MRNLNALLCLGMCGIVGICSGADERVKKPDASPPSTTTARGDRRIEHPHLAVTEVSIADQSVAIDKRLQSLVPAVRESPDLSRIISGGLAINHVKPAVSVGDKGVLHLREIGRLQDVVASALADVHYFGNDHPTELACVVYPLRRSDVLVCDFQAPLVQVGRNQKVRIAAGMWVCPDRATAVALFWLRRGGIWLVDRLDQGAEAAAYFKAAQRPGADGRAHDVPEARDLGEASYWFCTTMVYSVPIEASRALSGDRISFIRGNVVVEVEVQEQSYISAGNKPGWYYGHTKEGLAEAVEIGRSIDKALIAWDQK